MNVDKSDEKLKKWSGLITGMRPTALADTMWIFFVQPSICFLLRRIEDSSSKVG